MSSDNEQTEPFENAPGDEPEKPDLNETLVEINSNMGAMTILLQKLVESSFNRPTGHAETTSTGPAMNVPTGNILTGPTGSSMNVSTGHIESTGQGILSTSTQSAKPGPSNERKRGAQAKEQNLSSHRLNLLETMKKVMMTHSVSMLTRTLSWIKMSNEVRTTMRTMNSLMKLPKASM